MLNKYSFKQTATALCVTFVASLAVSPMVNAETAGLSSRDEAQRLNSAAGAGSRTGVDMAGNIVELGPNFDFGGDNMAKYADKKMATGVKDPAVCGTFSAAKCSVAHLQK